MTLIPSLHCLDYSAPLGWALDKGFFHHVFPSLASFSESKILLPEDTRFKTSRITMFVALKKSGTDCGFCSASWLVHLQSIPINYKTWGLWSTGIVNLWIKMTKLTKQQKSPNMFFGVINSKKILINFLKTGRGGLLFYFICFDSGCSVERTLPAILNQQLQELKVLPLCRLEEVWS